MTLKYSWLQWLPLLLVPIVVVGPFVTAGLGSLVQGPAQLWKDWFVLVAMALTGVLVLLFWFVRPLREAVEGLLRWPTWDWYWSKRFIRLGLGVPLIAVMSAFWLVLSIQAYVDVFAYWTGAPRAAVPATVLELVVKSGRGCKLLMTIRMGEAHEEICAEERVMGPLPVTGQIVWLQGKDTFAGFWVQKIHTAPQNYQRPTADKESCPMILLICPT